MATEKQVIANRLNALKSTGPKTPEGKARSRGNALKHGLAGEGVAVSEHDCRVYTARLKEWKKDVQPRGAVENWLVASAVAASVRVDRCRQAEWAELDCLRRGRMEAFQDEQQEHVKAILAENPSDFWRARFLLEEFTAGCEWLATTWKILRGRFTEQGFLQPGELADLVSLLGLDPERICVAQTREQELAKLNDCAQAGAEGAADARQALAAKFEENIQRLDRQARAHWIMEEARWLREDLDREAFDDTPRGQLLRRYETTSRNDVHRCLTQLARIRKDDILHPQAPPLPVVLAEPVTADPAPVAEPEAVLRNEADLGAAGNGSLNKPVGCAIRPEPPATPGNLTPRRSDLKTRHPHAPEVARTGSDG